MKNLAKLAEKIQSAAETRVKINGILWKKMKDISQIFYNSFFYLESHKSDFKRINDLLYYVGGWPSENTPPRLKSLARDIFITYNFYTLLGFDEFNKYLAEYGLAITVVDPEKAKIIFNKDQFNHGVKTAGLNNDQDNVKETDDAKIAVTELTDLGQYIQSMICAEADKIKLRDACEASVQHGINKRNFVIAVNNEAKRGLESNQEKAKKAHLNTYETVNELAEIEKYHCKN